MVKICLVLTIAHYALNILILITLAKVVPLISMVVTVTMVYLNGGNLDKQTILNLCWI